MKKSNQLNLNSFYIKPVQTGYPIDSDARFIQSNVSNAKVESIFNYKDPCSPHIAVGNTIVSDDMLIHQLNTRLNELIPNDSFSITFIETAGGFDACVNSPVMSGNLQSDVYRIFRFPSILVGDSNLGGISTTLSSYESLKMKGYDIPMILMFDNPKWSNQKVIQKYIDQDVKIHLVPLPPTRHLNSNIDVKQMKIYFEELDNDTSMIQDLLNSHTYRMERFKEMKVDGMKRIWWPFTQHRIIKEPMVIDSAFKDHLTVVESTTDGMNSVDYFDACASWWTQGLGHGNPTLAKTAAYAAGRYGHVIAPECIHEPADQLAKLLLDGAGKGWANRVFYSDNGSTAIEVAVKMALTNTLQDSDMDLINPTGKKIHWKAIGIEGSYHGDTIGAMDLSDPNVYNSRVLWYQGKGMWFKPPTYVMKNKMYHIQIPTEFESSIPESKRTFKTMEDIFYNDRPEFVQLYRDYIIKTLKYHSRLETQSDLMDRFGMLIIEPIIMGAGGMLFIDPLFHKELIDIVRNPQLWDSTSPPLPVIFDEVFVGMYRCGTNLPSISPLFNDPKYYPDIACYAKCLTGGLIPLSATLATSKIFNAFDGDTKLQALLHGHSYTAHPIGCAVAVQSIKEYQKMAHTSPKMSVWNEKTCQILIK
ncbi:hypothetical protein HDV02_001294 [Globomyces sp. JEL0801]|nr:hypothetical protein HDV02_001294 [Globomyces sp. JEL0801]